MKVIFNSFIEDDGSADWSDWFLAEDRPPEDSIKREDNGQIWGFDLIVDLPDEVFNTVVSFSGDISASNFPYDWDELQEIYMDAVHTAIITHFEDGKTILEQLEDYATRYPKLYADAFGQEVEA